MCAKLAYRAAAGIWVLVAACAGTARAGITTAAYNFEDQPVTAGNLTSLTLNNNGLSLTINRAGQPFDVTTLSAFGGTSAFGARTMAPTPPGMNAFTFNFSQPVSGFSANLGDFASGVTDQLAMIAFSGPNGTGAKLGTSNANMAMSNASTMTFQSLAINGNEIKSVQVTGGAASGENSVFYDNFNATFTRSDGVAVPLPPAIFVAPLGAAVAWLAARRLRRAGAR